MVHCDVWGFSHYKSLLLLTLCKLLWNFPRCNVSTRDDRLLGTDLRNFPVANLFNVLCGGSNHE